MKNSPSSLAMIFVAVFIPVAAFAWAGADTDPKGIFIASAGNGASGATGASPAMKFRIELSKNGKPAPVPSTYRFQSGDKFRLLFELNQDSYAYVVNRS